jgi:hypothetical protein
VGETLRGRVPRGFGKSRRFPVRRFQGRRRGTVGDETPDRWAIPGSEREGERVRGFSGWVTGLVSTQGQPRMHFSFFSSAFLFYLSVFSFEF